MLNARTSAAANDPRSFSWKDDRWVLPFLARYKKTLLLALTLGVATILFAVGLMFTSGYLIAGSAEMPYSVLLLSTPLLFVRLFGVGKPVLQYFERLTSHDWVLRITSILRKKLYLSFNENGIFFSSTYRLGDALGLVAEDIGHIQNLYLRTVLPAVIAWTSGLALTIVLGCYTWWIGIAFGAVILIELVVVPAVSVSINGIRQERAKQLTRELYAQTTDSLLGIYDWKLSGRRDEYLHLCDEQIEALTTLRNEGHRFDRGRDLAVSIAFILGALLIIVWSTWCFQGTADSSSNWILAFTLGYFPLIDAITPLPNAAVEARGHRDALARLNDLPQPSEERKMNGDSRNVERFAPFDIELDHVRFAYPDAPATMLLDDVSLSIPPGQHIAILGKSGAGKSTLASLVRGDIDPASGTVRIGSDSAGELGSCASAVFGVIQQSTYLFNTTLRDNLLIGRADATDEELESALDSVGLHALRMRLPRGLDTLVDEAGLRFSGGERHRIALARILLQDAPIVILDEPTVGLDPLTEHDVITEILDHLEGKTVLMITHHLMGVSRMDRVIYLKEGSIEFDGVPDELEQTSDFYRALLALDRGSNLTA